MTEAESDVECCWRLDAIDREIMQELKCEGQSSFHTPMHRWEIVSSNEPEMLSAIFCFNVDNMLESMSPEDYMLEYMSPEG